MKKSFDLIVKSWEEENKWEISFESLIARWVCRAVEKSIIGIKIH